MITQDIITTTGSILDLPQFLVESTRQIVYRLKQAGIWHKDNDIRLYVPKKYTVEFAYVWSNYFLAGLDVMQRISDDAIIVDNIKIKVYEGQSDRYYLVVIRMGTNHLQEWDSTQQRWLFKTPWAIAGFEAIE